MNRFFDRHKKTIIWVMVIGFFLGSVGLAAFQYMRPGGGGQSSDGSSGKQVALVVNDEEIYQSEFQSTYDNALQRQKQLYSQFGQDFSRLLEGASGKLYELRMKSRTVDSLVRRALVEQEAEERGLEAKSAKVEQEYNDQLDSILEQQGWTLEQLKSALSSQGMTYEQFEKSTKESIRRQLKQEKLKDEVVGGIDPSDEELSTYYQDNIDTYVQTPSRVKADHLVFETQTEAKTIKERITAEPDYFEEYAEQNDLETDMGWFSKGEKSQAIDDLAFSLKVGEVGGPVRTPQGWEVLKVTDKQERVVPELAEIKDKVRKDYVSSREQEKYNNWYEEVKKKAEIEIELPSVKAYREAQGGFQAGVEAYQDLKNRTPEVDPYAPYYLGRLYQEQISELEGDQEDQVDEETQAKIDEYRKKAIENYMEVVRQAGSSDGDLLNRVVRLAPENAVANYYLGRYQFDNKRYSSAASSFQQAIEARPDYVAAYLDYGRMLVELQDYEKAAKQFKQALDRAPENVNIMNQLANAYLEADQYGKAEETYKKVLEESPDNFEAKKGLGNLYLEGENYDEAIDYYNDALSIRADADTSLSLSRAYLDSGQLEDAKAELNNVINTNPYNAEAYMLFGDYYRKKGSSERALEEYREGLARTQAAELRIRIGERVIELAPEAIETRFTLARAYREQHVYNSATDQYDKILETTDKKTEEREAYLGLAETYMKKTDYGKAKENYQKGLELADSAVQKVSFYEGLLKADEEQNGKDNLTEVGKEALLRIAEININQGSTSTAKDKLNRLSELDSDYKEARVEELLNQVSPSNGSSESTGS